MLKALLWWLVIILLPHRHVMNVFLIRTCFLFIHHRSLFTFSSTFLKAGTLRRYVHKASFAWLLQYFQLTRTCLGWSRVSWTCNQEIQSLSAASTSSGSLGLCSDMCSTFSISFVSVVVSDHADISLYYFYRKFANTRTTGSQPAGGRPMSRCCDCEKVWTTVTQRDIIRYFSCGKCLNF